MAKTKKSRDVYDSYGYALVNGKEYYGRFESSGDGKSREFVRYGRYISIEHIAVDLDDGSSILTIGYDTLNGRREFIKMRRDMLAKKKDVQSLLLKCGADAYDTSLPTLMNCLRVSEDSATDGRCFHRTGWIVDFPGTENEMLYFKGSTLIGPKIANVHADYVGPYDLSPKGTFADWKSMISNYVLGSVALEVAVLIGLSAIISCEWGARNLVFHFKGDSSTGKTTSAILAISTTGCPNPAETAKNMNAEGKPLRSLLSSWKGTANALIGKLDGLDGTLMVFDELSKVESTELLTSTIYTLSDGADKDRMLSPTEMQTTNTIRTNILSVGEESLLEKAGSKNSGLNVRVCEINTCFTNSPAQSEAIVATCYENYGHAGPRFAQYIANHLSHDDVTNLRHENLTFYTSLLESKGFQSKSLRRLAEFGAILLTTANIANEALGIPFNRDAIADFLAEQQLSAESNADIGTRAHTALRGYVNANIGSFIANGSTTWSKSIPCLGKVDHPKGGSMEASIICEEFPGIMKRLGFNNPSLIIQKFKAMGLLDHEAGKTYRKRQITKAGGTARVYVVKFP